jgi:glycosyltransferase involved in cell wall biosynthesis
MRPVALAHDYLTQRGGAERVFLSMARAFPDSPLLTTLYEPAQTYQEFADHEVQASPLQQVALFRRHFKAALPLFPAAIRSMGPVAARVLVSSSTAFAHGLESAGCHVAYVHSPPHWLWESRRYAGDRGGLAACARPLLGPFRRLDLRAARRPHLILTNSLHSARKIRAVYGRTAEVLHPPVRARRATSAPGDFFLVVARLLPYKNVHLVVRAAERLGARLVVVGEGPERARLAELAGPGTEFRSRLPEAQLDELYARCIAVVVAGEEDFGLVAIEANSAGRPAVCHARGGALETVVPGETGVLFAEQRVEAVAEAMAAAAARSWDGAGLQRHARRWSEERFAGRLRLLADAFPDWCARCGGPGLGPRPLEALLEMGGPPPDHGQDPVGVEGRA